MSARDTSRDDRFTELENALADEAYAMLCWAVTAMSNRDDGWDSGGYDLPPLLVTAAVKRRAALVVCGRARSIGDARYLLTVLGLLDDDDRAAAA